MPGKNTRKQYVKNGYYHVYNRGVEKRKIFVDEQDYSVFLSYLKEYLLPKNIQELSDIVNNENSPPFEKNKALKLIRLNNFATDISLIAYCLMPNHFHLLIKQNSRDSMDKFMNSFCTRYTMYFNAKYERVGKLYEGTYKAVIVSTDEQLLHLSRYIHSNPIKLKTDKGDALFGQPSSLPIYLGLNKATWVSSNEILSFFSKTNPKLSYKNFMGLEEDANVLENLKIDD